MQDRLTALRVDRAPGDAALARRKRPLRRAPSRTGYPAPRNTAARSGAIPGRAESRPPLPIIPQARSSHVLRSFRHHPLPAPARPRRSGSASTPPDRADAAASVVGPHRRPESPAHARAPRRTDPSTRQRRRSRLPVSPCPSAAGAGPRPPPPRRAVVAPCLSPPPGTECLLPPSSPLSILVLAGRRALARHRVKLDRRAIDEVGPSAPRSRIPNATSAPRSWRFIRRASREGRPADRTA